MRLRTNSECVCVCVYLHVATVFFFFFFAAYFQFLSFSLTRVGSRSPNPLLCWLLLFFICFYLSLYFLQAARYACSVVQGSPFAAAAAAIKTKKKLAI